jgi:type II secretory pathway predicted ATPase ExeA
MTNISSPGSRLADASGFFIRTPMMEALHRQIEDWTQCGHTGGLILGEARQGKTTAIRALSEKLINRNAQTIPLFRVHFGRRDLDSIRAVFAKIARSLGYQVSRGHTSDALQERISIRLAEAAQVNDDRKVVLVVDEAQTLKLAQFDAFAELYNELFEMRINFVVFFVANQDLFQPLGNV